MFLSLSITILSIMDCNNSLLGLSRFMLMKKDIEIARLKKGYIVKEGGTEEKGFITFSKKNTK